MTDQASSPNLISLIYASSAARPIATDELLTILGKARENNKLLDITGMLLYRNGNFLQALEGPESAVTTLYSTIQQDPRHYQVTKILQRPIQKRDFADWEMGFVDLNQSDLAKTPGYSDFLKQALEPQSFSDNPSIAYEFLLAFKEGMR